MKLSIVATCLVSSACAFAPPSSRTTTSSLARFSTATADADPYVTLGVTQEEVALGIDVDELVQHGLTKEEIKSRIIRDVTEFSELEAEMEATKIMLDQENLKRLIFYEENKELIEAQGDQQPQGGGVESLFTFTNVLGAYAVFLAGQAILPAIREKVAAGEMSPIPFLAPAVGEATTDAAAEAVQSAVESASDVISAAF